MRVLKKRAVLEKHIEGPVVKYATERGMLVLKLNTMGRAHWPDRMFLMSNRVLFIEFKRPGEKPTPAQAQIHKQLREQGFQVNVVDDIARGKADIDLFAAGFDRVETVGQNMRRLNATAPKRPKPKKIKEKYRTKPFYDHPERGG